MKKTTTTFLEAKSKGRKLVVMTAYDYSIARLADPCDIDAILVGDSLGMVCLGYKDTLRVTMEDMIHHTKAVSGEGPRRSLISDMPFMSAPSLCRRSGQECRQTCPGRICPSSKT